MTMDSESGDRRQLSPALSDTAGSWIPFWDGEDGSLSCLSGIIDASSELHHLVEDKEIASKAVAFVVNSTRKGIVPLCADVATLMRAKFSLDRKVSALRTENNILRSSLATSVRTSESDSPASGSVVSYSSDPSHGHVSPQNKSSPSCSQSSSQCSSIDSTSPKFEKHTRPRSPRLHRTSAFSVPRSHSHRYHGDMHSHVTVAMVHPAPPNKSRHRRKNSLPEMISEPYGNVQKVSPRTSKVSTGVQCVLLAPPTGGKEQCGDQLPNSEAVVELAEARREIDSLKIRLRELEMKDLARRFNPDHFHVENEYAQNNQSKSPTSNEHSSERKLTHPVEKNPTRQGTMASTSDGPIRIEPPLEGCKCRNCEKTRGPLKRRDSVSLRVCDQGASLANGDHVVLAGQRTGRVMYIGHVDDKTEPHVVYAGLQLDAPVSDHDGVLHGRRYFTCEEKCGVIVPVHEILYVIAHKEPELDPVITPLHGTKEPVQEPKTSVPRMVPLATSKHKSHNRHSNHGKEKRYLNRTSSNLKLPKDPGLSNGHLV